jgi:hypothetical protein
MTHITQIIADITTGDASGADADGPVYLRVGPREFRLDKTGDQFKRHTTDRFVFGSPGPGGSPNVKNPGDNDPQKPIILLPDLGVPFVGSTPTVPPNPPYTVHIRYESNIKWLVEAITVRVIGDPSVSSPSFSVPFGVKNGIIPPGIWLGEDFAKFLYLQP